MNSENSKTTILHRLLLKLASKIEFKRGKKSAVHTWKNIKSSYKNHKFKVSPPTWNDKFELPHGSYSISDIQDFFHIL